VRTFTQCSTGLTHKCVVEFYLDWLEELADRRDAESESTFGHVAAGLTRIAPRPGHVVLDGLRPFPVPPSGQGWDQIQIDPADFAVSIADRVFDIEEREGTPKVLPHAIRAFGLKPRTKGSDVALMQ
jgi:hypothetical protein